MAQDGIPVERACDRCRERRVKCDKRHPECARCEKLGKPCPGYDKKRKFVDEGVGLRRKYHASAGSEDISQLVASSSRPAISGRNSLLSDHTSPESYGMKAETKSPSDSADNVGPKAGWNINNTNSFSLFNAVDITSSQTGTMPDLQPTDMNKAIDDILNDPSFDPAWFNLDPTDYYSSVGNSCGFLSDIPNIIDEVDRDHILESIERTTDPIEEDKSWAPQLHTSAIIIDEREHEMAYLIRHFTESIGPWMDLFDHDEHFGSLVPLKALRDALLRNAIAAVSAKQLGRIKSAKPFVDNQNQKPAMMEVIDEVDWFYKAANYYDKAIAFSRLYLQAISDSFSNPPTPGSQVTVASPNSDDLLVAVSIFSLYEWLDNLDLDWLQHLSGLKTLLSTLKDVEDTSGSNIAVTVGRRASFWNFSRADYLAAYVNHQYTFLDTEDFQLWRSCGLEIQTDGSIYRDPVNIKDNPKQCRQTAELVAHTILWLLLRTMNYIASDTESSPFARHERWQELNKQLDFWYDNLPQTFQPCAQMRYTVRTRASTATSALVEVFFSMNVCAAALQLYHFARILLLLNRPDHSSPADNADAKAQAIKHAHQIIGIALGRPHPAVRVEMLLPLYVAGTCLEAEEERNVVLELLRAIEKDTGCSTESRCLELTSVWGWNGKMDVVMASM